METLVLVPVLPLNSFGDSGSSANLSSPRSPFL